GSTPSYTGASSAASSSTGPARPARLACAGGRSSAAAGATITPAVTVAVEDANGNIETSDNATQVSLAIGTNPAGGTLSGGSAVTVASGITTVAGPSEHQALTHLALTAPAHPPTTQAPPAQQHGRGAALL